MNTSPPKTTRSYTCFKCPLARFERFRAHSPEELAYVENFKRGELVCDAGATILLEGTHSPHLYTVLSGWGFRYKMLSDGRRQILNYVIPGDFLGLQGAVLDEMQHSIEALSDMILCVFERNRLPELYENQPNLSFDITWLAAREEQMLDEHLLSVGRRSALERAAYLLAFLHDRVSAVELFGKNSRIAPLTQQHVADTLGLSLVHTNKTLRKLANEKAIEWLDSGFEIRDADRLEQIAGWENEPRQPRPYI